MVRSGSPSPIADRAGNEIETLTSSSTKDAAMLVEEFVRISFRLDGCSHTEIYLIRRSGSCRLCESPHYLHYLSEHREIEQAVARRLADEPQIYAKRKELAELPFGLMKSIWGYEQFMVSGHKGCNGELNLMGFCFNWKRVLNLVGMERLMEAIIACLVQIGHIFSQYRTISGVSHFRMNFLSQIAAA